MAGGGFIGGGTYSISIGSQGVLGPNGITGSQYGATASYVKPDEPNYDAKKLIGQKIWINLEGEWYKTLPIDESDINPLSTSTVRLRVPKVIPNKKLFGIVLNHKDKIENYYLTNWLYSEHITKQREEKLEQLL